MLLNIDGGKHEVRNKVKLVQDSRVIFILDRSRKKLVQSRTGERTPLVSFFCSWRGSVLKLSLSILLCSWNQCWEIRQWLCSDLVCPVLVLFLASTWCPEHFQIQHCRPLNTSACSYPCTSGLEQWCILGPLDQSIKGEFLVGPP